MAPNTVTSSQEFFIQAAQKLSTAVSETGTVPNDFAKNLLELLEVSTKINQFDEMASTANEETASAEAQQWREISLLTMQHARTHLLEQQRRLIEGLRELSEAGASLYKSPDALPDQRAVKPLPGGDPEQKLDQMAVKPPPGLAAPPGLSMSFEPTKVTKSKPVPPSTLKPPPGLASAGTAPVTPPPGFNALPNRKAPRAPKKEAAVHPWRMNKKSDDKFTSLYEARLSKGSTDTATSSGTETTASSSMLNLDAYESD